MVVSIMALTSLFLSACSYPSPIGNYSFYLDGALQERLSLTIFNTASIEMHNGKQTKYSMNKLKWYRTTSLRKSIDEETGEEIIYSYDPVIIYLAGDVNVTWTFILEDNGCLLEVTSTTYSIPRLFVRN